MYTFLQNAIVAAMLSGITCGLVGSYIVARRNVAVSGGVTHASFGGIGLAYMLGFNPILGAAIFALLAAVGIEFAGQKWRIREDSAIGIVWSVGMALGVIFIALTPGYAPNLTAVLFGNILTVTRTDIVCLGVLTGVVLVVFGFGLRRVMWAAFDGEFARSQGVRVRAISYGMGVLAALTMVFSIRAVGIVLLISLVTFPAVIAGSVTRDFRRIALWSAVVAVCANLAGLVVSWQLNIPTGGATILVLTLGLVVVKAFQPLRGRAG